MDDRERDDASDPDGTPPEPPGEAERDTPDATADAETSEVDADEDAESPDASAPLEDDDAPLADLVREIRSRGEGTDADAGGDRGTAALFESVEVPDVDEEAVWSALDGAEDDPATQVGLGATPTDRPDDEEAVVAKRDYCQRCPHFADPPETACTHEDTTIVEVVSAEEFRVRNCPVVAEERGSPPTGSE
jgi:hypothetical protein